jgi:GTP cyclohydrolase I
MIKKNKLNTSSFDEDISSSEENEYGHIENLEKIITGLLEDLGEDIHREGLLKTPTRVAKAYRFLTKGYSDELEKLLNDAIFKESYDEIVIVKNIDFYSLCEHHLLPFYGKCHVAYLPDKKIIGLSKIPRIVEMFSRRLQVQERMTTQIGNLLNKVLSPKGVAVVAEAKHLCMMMRGVEKQNSVATTSCMIGEFKSNSKTRSEFLKLISSSFNL